MEGVGLGVLCHECLEVSNVRGDFSPDCKEGMRNEEGGGLGQTRAAGRGGGGKKRLADIRARI